MKVINLVIFNIIVLLAIIIIFFIIVDKELYKNILIIITSIAILINGFVYYLENKNDKKLGNFLFIDINKNILSKTITNDHEFKKYIYSNYCQCIKQCLDMEGFINKNPISGYIAQPICHQIIITDSDKKKESSYDNDILFALNYLIKKQILIRSNKKFYINTNDNKLKLRWENIKLYENFKDKNEDKQILLWLLRKLVVDAILKKILLKYSNPGENFCDIYSVGSTNMTSDYDVSLYGDDNNKVIIINEFQQLFKKYFTEESSIVFDTNIYGKAYIYYGKNTKFDKNIVIQSDKTTPAFYYLQFNIEGIGDTFNPNSQLMWGIIKFLKDLSEGFDEKIYNEYVQHLQKLDYKIIDKAVYTLKFLLNQDEEKINYSSVMSMSKDIGSIYKDKYKDNKDILSNIDILIEHDIIALVSFYGLETYYTRGAFLDVVVNQQMLSEQPVNKIELSEIEYITSILENAGFYLVHNTKSKYIIRVYKTLTLLLKLIKTDEEKLIKPNDKKLIKNKTDLENIIILFNKYKDKTNIGEFVEDTNKYCSIINKDEINKDEINKNKINKDEINKDEINKDKINILKCHKYQIFNIIFDLIYNILNYVKLSIKDNTIPFYDLLVIQENKIFKLLDDKKPDKFKTIINKFKNRTKVTPGLPDLKPGPSDLDLNPVGIQ